MNKFKAIDFCYNTMIFYSKKGGNYMNAFITQLERFARESYEMEVSEHLFPNEEKKITRINIDSYPNGFICDSTYDGIEINQSWIWVNYKDLYDCYYICLQYIIDNKIYNYKNKKNYDENENILKIDLLTNVKIIFKFKELLFKWFNEKITVQEERQLFDFASKISLGELVKICLDEEYYDICEDFKNLSNDEVETVINLYKKSPKIDSKNKIIFSYITCLLTKRKGAIPLKNLQYYPIGSGEVPPQFKNTTQDLREQADDLMERFENNLAARTKSKIIASKIVIH